MPLSSWSLSPTAVSQGAVSNDNAATQGTAPATSWKQAEIVCEVVIFYSAPSSFVLHFCLQSSLAALLSSLYIMNEMERTMAGREIREH